MSMGGQMRVQHRCNLLEHAREHTILTTDCKGTAAKWIERERCATADVRKV